MGKIPKPEPTGVGKEIQKEIERLKNVTLETKDKTTLQATFKQSLAKTLSIFRDFMRDKLVEAYKKGIDKAKSKTPDSIRKEDQTSEERAKERANKAYTRFDKDITAAYQRTYKTIAAEIVKAEKKALTYQLKQKIEVKLLQQGFIKVMYEGNRAVPVDAYAEMCANTASIEAFNTGAIDYAQSVTDLVEMTTIFPTCNICAKYQGRVYSVSGNDKRYPPLYGENAPLQNGFNTVHPNCRHEFVPYNEIFDTEEERKKKQEKSNRSFVDDRTENNRKTYQRWQEVNAETRERKNERLLKV